VTLYQTHTFFIDNRENFNVVFQGILHNLKTCHLWQQHLIWIFFHEIDSTLSMLHFMWEFSLEERNALLVN